jgi:hypothetical protein
MLPGHAVLPQGRTPARKGGEASLFHRGCWSLDTPRDFYFCPEAYDQKTPITLGFNRKQAP